MDIMKNLIQGLLLLVMRIGREEVAYFCDKGVRLWIIWQQQPKTIIPKYIQEKREVDRSDILAYDFNDDANYDF